MLETQRRIWVIPMARLAIGLPAKVACTSIKSALSDYGGGWKRGIMEETPVPDDHLALLPVRSPWERVRSCYTGNIYKQDISPEFLDIGCSPDMTLDAFIDILMDWPDNEMDRHVAPQHYLLESPRWTASPHLLRLERLHEEWGKWNLPPLPHLNQSKERKPKWKKSHIRKIRQKYQRDIDLLSYEPPEH